MSETRRNLVLVGGGGHCASIIDVVESTERFRILGIAEKHPKPGDEILSYPVRYSDEELEDLSEDASFCITVGQIETSAPRRRIWDMLSSYSAEVPTVRSPLSRVSSHASILDGTTIGHFSLVNSRVAIGRCCIINSGAIIEHDVSVGDFSHISTGALVNGDVKIGSDVFIGSKSVIRQGVRIVSHTLIGMGSVVIRDIEEPGVYAGNPLRKIR